MHTCSRSSVMRLLYLCGTACFDLQYYPVAPKAGGVTCVACAACEAMVCPWWYALGCHPPCLRVSVSYPSFPAPLVLGCLFPHLADPLTYILIKSHPKDAETI